MTPRKRFPLGRHGRPEGGWGCPHAVALWFSRAADDLDAIAAGVKELGLMAHNDNSRGRMFAKMVDDLFGGQSLFALRAVLDAAAKVADELHPVNYMPDMSAPFPPPPAAGGPHPWGDPDLHPIPCLHGPDPEVHPLYQVRPPAPLGIPVVGEIDSDDLKRLFAGEVVDSPGMRALDAALTGHKVKSPAAVKPRRTTKSGRGAGKRLARV